MHHSEEELEDFNEQQIESIRIQNRGIIKRVATL